MVKIRHKDIDEKHYQNAIPNKNSNLRASIGTEKTVGEYYYLKTDSLIPFSKQARKLFNEVEINQLANTIREHGIRQPLTVVPSQGQIDKFEVISGERRLRAAQIVGLEVVPCIIIKDNEKAEEIALIENIQRSDLHPIEFSEAILSLSKNSKWGDISNIAEKVGKPVSTISEAISIAKLPDDIKNHLIKNNIRSRDIIRKLTSLDYAQMKTMLGLEEGEKASVQYSVLRITKNGDEYKIQDRGIKRLNNEERESLKKHLLNLLKKL